MGMKMKTDSLGRVVIPFQMRNELNINKNDMVDIEMCDGVITISVIPACAICGSRESLTDIEEKFLCSSCLEKVKRVG